MTEPRTSNVSWRDYVDTRLEALEKIGIASAKANEYRLNKLNDHEARMEQLRATMLSRPEHAVEHNALADSVKRIENEQAELRGRATSGSVYVAYGLSAVSIILAVIGVVLGFLKGV